MIKLKNPPTPYGQLVHQMLMMKVNNKQLSEREGRELLEAWFEPFDSDATDYTHGMEGMHG